MRRLSVTLGENELVFQQVSYKSGCICIRKVLLCCLLHVQGECLGFSPYSLLMKINEEDSSKNIAPPVFGNLREQSAQSPQFSR